MVSSPVVEKCKAIFVYLQFDVTAGVNGNQDNKYFSFYLTVFLRVFFVSLFFFPFFCWYLCASLGVWFSFSQINTHEKRNINLNNL